MWDRERERKRLKKKLGVKREKRGECQKREREEIWKEDDEEDEGGGASWNVPLPPPPPPPPSQLKKKKTKPKTHQKLMLFLPFYLLTNTVAVAAVACSQLLYTLFHWKPHHLNWRVDEGDKRGLYKSFKILFCHSRPSLTQFTNCILLHAS